MLSTFRSASRFLSTTLLVMLVLCMLPRLGMANPPVHHTLTTVAAGHAPEKHPAQVAEPVDVAEGEFELNEPEFADDVAGEWLSSLLLCLPALASPCNTTSPAYSPHAGTCQPAGTSIFLAHRVLLI